MISVRGLRKAYRVARRPAGLGHALKALFSRRYETVHALDGVSFDIPEGQLVGYIGPNGAGKSTTLKILCGILTPDGGSCVVDGRVPWRDRVAHVAGIGAVFGQRSQLWWDVPVIDSFELLRDLYRVEPSRYRRALDELAALLDLDGLLETPARNLSLGQRMRCEIAASLLHGPRLLFLDEPTIGLDAVSKLAVRRFLRRRCREHGTTLLLTTHDMPDIEALAQRILLIGRGRILLDGTLDDLRRRSPDRKRLVLEHRGPAPSLAEGMTLLEAGEGRTVIGLDPSVTPVSRAIALLAGQADIRDLSVSGATAEEMVAALYREYRL